MFRLNPLSHNHSQHNLHSHYHHPNSFHHNSFDELSTLKLNRNLYYPQFLEMAPRHQQQQHQQQHEYQWPKVIPKSPSSFSMNSFRMKRQSQFDRSSNCNPIEEFDLDKIEHERRKSHTNLFNEGRQNDLKKDFGTAV